MKIKLTAEMRMRLAYAEELDITDIVAPIIAERNELAATVEVLCEALYDQLNDCINFDGGKLTDTIMEHSTKILQITPQQHLRDVRADAVCDFIDYMYRSKDCQLCSNSLDIASNYAESVRAGEV